MAWAGFRQARYDHERLGLSHPPLRWAQNLKFHAASGGSGGSRGHVADDSVGHLNLPPAILSAETAARWKQQRFNPLRSLTPATLGSYIEQYDAGYLRGFSLTAEQIGERDDTAAVVIPKRRKQVSSRPWDILIGEDVAESDQAEAMKHQATLKTFYSTLQTRSAVQKNESGGLRLALRQSMNAVFMRYATHEIEWLPGTDGLRAVLHHVPLHFMDDTQGELRFAGVNGTTPGVALDPQNWLVAVHDGCLMKAISICYMFKRLSLADWLNFSELFGIPARHLETQAPRGSKEWNDAVTALSSFANDWGIVTSVGEKLNLVQAGMSGDGPFSPMVDRCDRAMARLALGSDLSTLSRENGAGASLQGADNDELISDDCEWLSELYQEQLSRRVIEWTYGEGTEPLAFFQIAPPQNQDTELEMKVDEHAKNFGVNLTPEDIAERYGRTHEPLAQPAAANEATVPRALANLRKAQMTRLKSGLKADLKPAQTALQKIEDATTDATMRSAVQAIDPRAIEAAVMTANGAEEAMQVIIAAEFLKGLVTP